MNGSVSFHAVSRETSGQYKCHASNTEGNVTHITKVKVIGKSALMFEYNDLKSVPNKPHQFLSLILIR